MEGFWGSKGVKEHYAGCATPCAVVLSDADVYRPPISSARCCKHNFLASFFFPFFEAAPKGSCIVCVRNVRHSVLIFGKHI